MHNKVHFKTYYGKNVKQFNEFKYTCEGSSIICSPWCKIKCFQKLSGCKHSGLKRWTPNLFPLNHYYYIYWYKEINENIFDATTMLKNKRASTRDVGNDALCIAASVGIFRINSLNTCVKTLRVAGLQQASQQTQKTIPCEPRFIAHEAR